MGIEIEQTVYEVIPVGDYPAAIASIEAEDGQFGPQLCFTFEIVDGEYAGERLKAWCSQKFSTKSKLYQWTRAAFGREIPQTYRFNSDHLLNKRVILTVIQKMKDDGTEFNKVEAVKRYKAAQATKPADEPIFPGVEEEDEVPF